MFYSKNCIICGKEASTWSGHIHTEMGRIISGWCQEHYGNNGVRPAVIGCEDDSPMSCDGYYSLREVPLREELNVENIISHLKYVEFHDNCFGNETRIINKFLSCKGKCSNEPRFITVFFAVAFIASIGNALFALYNLNWPATVGWICAASWMYLYRK